MSFYEQDPLAQAPFLELPAYQYGSLGVNLSGRRNNYSLLEPVRPFLFGPYFWRGLVIPRASVIIANNPDGLTPFQQVEDRFPLPKGSWIVGFSAFSQQDAGFRFQIYDLGAKEFVLCESWMQNQTDAHDPSGAADGIGHILPHPYCVVSASANGWGMLQAKLVNSSNLANDCQLLIHVACPLNTKLGVSSR
jgi:hypothetical protein